MASYASVNHKYCKVQHCRFNQCHINEGHLCGKCNQYGHGQIECGNDTKLDKLKKSYGLVMPFNMRCTISGCKFPWSHNTRSHNCHKCFKNHSSRDCIIQPLEHYINKFGLDQERINSIEYYFNNAGQNCYIIVYAGMGCNLYFKKNNDIIEGLFMHSDSFGQYGVETSDKPTLDKFIEHLSNKTEDYAVLDLNNLGNSKKTIECPICRIKNDTSKVVEIKGLSDECSICYSNKVEIYFPECKHAIVCKDCFKLL